MAALMQEIVQKEVAPIWDFLNERMKTDPTLDKKLEVLEHRCLDIADEQRRRRADEKHNGLEALQRAFTGHLIDHAFSRAETATDEQIRKFLELQSAPRPPRSEVEKFEREKRERIFGNDAEKETLA